ncbi:hypothetical protein KW850_04135 [Bacillus sp. sid0103]|uniref:hypothetical protein n=1 Tax=Bacillus sp. sid0103 TaxID=2856337 RepID=UPI001C47DBD2|nr:hypothetical protein [Bacillus sp. sid0103]MBV7504454.1 hypothetical protein [Bacillus sp. sid0103]
MTLMKDKSIGLAGSLSIVGLMKDKFTVPAARFVHHKADERQINGSCGEICPS